MPEEANGARGAIGGSAGCGETDGRSNAPSGDDAAARDGGARRAHGAGGGERARRERGRSGRANAGRGDTLAGNARGRGAGANGAGGEGGGHGGHPCSIKLDAWGRVRPLVEGVARRRGERAFGSAIGGGWVDFLGSR